MTPSGEPPHDEPEDAAAHEWRHLERRMLFLLSGICAAFLAPIPFLVLTGVKGVILGVGITLASIGLTFLVIWLAYYAQYRTTSYRVTPERFELRTGVFAKNRHAVARDRIRSVDLRATPFHRVLGLMVVRISSGQHSKVKNELELDSVTKPVAAALRRELLHRAAPAEEAPVEADGEIARVKPSWIRFAPMTFMSVGLGFGVFGVAARVFGDFRIDPRVVPGVSGLWERLQTDPVLVGSLTLVGATVIATLVGAVGSMALFVEGWWGYRLDRERGGTLRVRRGLLTTRTVSLEEERLRGIDLVEPLLLRWSRGAYVKAVATGLAASKKNAQQDTLLPPTPKIEAERVADAVLRHPEPVTDAASMQRHTHAALRRRLTRATVAVVIAGVLLATAQWWFGAALGWGWLAVVLLIIPAAFGLAADSYRGLRHALRGRFLVSRSGSLVRRTVALRRDGIIGWTITQSIFQRWSGLVTVAATTAAGRGAYKTRDVTVAEGVDFASEAVPKLLEPFVERPQPRGDDSA